MRSFFRASPRSLAAAAVILAVSASLAMAQPGSEKKSSDTGSGVLVAAVEPGSPAQKAGIVRGDIILEAAGSAVDTPEELKAAVEAKKPGDSLALKIRHGDATRTVNVVLADEQGRPVIGVMPVPSMGGRGTRWQVRVAALGVPVGEGRARGECRAGQPRGPGRPRCGRRDPVRGREGGWRRQLAFRPHRLAQAR